MKPRNKLIYLASPYTHADDAVRYFREQEICRIAAALKRQGKHAYCPIAETTSVARHGKLVNTTWEEWREDDLTLLSRCDEIQVAMIDGWNESRGIRGEVKFALKNNIPVSFIMYEDADDIESSDLDINLYFLHGNEKWVLAMFDVNSVDELND